jgi:hypothetical protein
MKLIVYYLESKLESWKIFLNIRSRFLVGKLIFFENLIGKLNFIIKYKF